MRNSWLTSLSLLLLIAPAAAQTPKPTPPPLAFPSGVDVVNVDVVVTDKKGTPVPGLTREDFTLSEDGSPQTVGSFEAIQIEARAPAAPSVPERVRVSTNAAPIHDSGRSFVVVFDDVHLSTAKADKAKEALKAFFGTSLRDGDRLTLVATSGGAWWSTRMEAGREDAVAFLARLKGLRNISLSSDYISDYEAMQIYVHRDERVGAEVQKRFYEYGAISDPLSAGAGAELDLGQGHPLVRVKAAEVYQQATARNKATLHSLERILNSLALSKGRKSVILLSEGFIYDSSLTEFQRVVSASRRANAAIYFLDARGLTGLPDSSDATIGPAIDEHDLGSMLNRSFQEADGSNSMAVDSGGFTIRNSNDIADGLARIVSESRTYYLLGYNSTNTRRDGKFRKIKVELKRPGLEVHARKGYYAPKDGEKQELKPDALDPAVQAVLDAPVGSAGVKLRMTSYVLGGSSSGKATVLVQAEADPANFTFASRGGRFEDSLETFFIVSTRNTGENQHQEKLVELSLPAEVRTQLQKTWLPIVRDFELAPGAYQVRFAVREAGSGRLGSVTHDFDVPALDQLRLSTPVLTDALQSPGPGQPARPALIARRSFAAGARLYCQFEVYGAAKDASGVPKVSAGYTLRRSDGLTVGGMDPTPIPAGPQGQLSRILALALKDTGPGEYEIALVVKDEVAGKDLVVREPFTVEVEPGAK